MHNIVELDQGLRQQQGWGILVWIPSITVAIILHPLILILLSLPILLPANVIYIYLHYKFVEKRMEYLSKAIANDDPQQIKLFERLKLLSPQMILDTAICTIRDQGSPQIIRHAIALGADVNVGLNIVPLYQATYQFCEYGTGLQNIELLLEANANVNGFQDNRPLICAIRKNNALLVDKFLERNPDLELTGGTFESFTPLGIATTRNYTPFIRKLILKGASTDRALADVASNKYKDMEGINRALINETHALWALELFTQSRQANGKKSKFTAMNGKVAARILDMLWDTEERYYDDEYKLARRRNQKAMTLIKGIATKCDELQATDNPEDGEQIILPRADTSVKRPLTRTEKAYQIMSARQKAMNLI